MATLIRELLTSRTSVPESGCPRMTSYYPWIVHRPYRCVESVANLLPTHQVVWRAGPSARLRKFFATMK
jgi:hypothetical protein